VLHEKNCWQVLDMVGSMARQARRQVVHKASQRKEITNQNCMSVPAYNHANDSGQPTGLDLA